MYGKELIMDLHDCDPRLFNRIDMEQYFIELCEVIDMVRADLHWWDYENNTYEEYKAAPPHLRGTSAVQFIKTSTIVIHALDELRTAYINIFSCKEFDTEEAKEFTEKWFDGKATHVTVVERD